MLESDSPYTIHDIDFWKISLSLALASFFVFASIYAIQPLLPVFVADYGISVSASSLLLSLTIIGLIIGLIILGFLSDRLGRTIFIKLSLIGTVIPFLMIPLFESYYLFIILRFLQGFASAGLLASALAYLNEEMDRRSVGVATGLYISSNALGGMAGRVVTGYLTDHYSWPTAFYVLGLAGVFIFFIVLFLLPKSRYFKPSELPFRKDLIGFGHHLKTPSLLVVFGLGIILQFSFTGVWTYLPFYLEGPPFELSLKTISYMFFAYGIGIIASPIAGWMVGHLKLTPMRVAGVLVLSSGVFITLSSSIIMIVIGLCVLCLGFFIAHSLTATTVSEQATHHKGSAASLYLVSYYIGVAFGSTLLSPIWSSFGWSGLVLVAGFVPLIYIIFAQLMSRKMRTIRAR
ncbi:MFS transporter [Cerasibacillus terrae]|uniref:MFS transporter n=1 Tax=Cerasibacillus terrae TaxID=2498845 RepID=A0A5C8NV35_9BACI|nr:MFS transporter [Cerasibacillus terrae]